MVEEFYVLRSPVRQPCHKQSGEIFLWPASSEQSSELDWALLRCDEVTCFILEAGHYISTWGRLKRVEHDRLHLEIVINLTWASREWTVMTVEWLPDRVSTDQGNWICRQLMLTLYVDQFPVTPKSKTPDKKTPGIDHHGSGSSGRREDSLRSAR